MVFVLFSGYSFIQIKKYIYIHYTDKLYEYIVFALFSGYSFIQIKKFLYIYTTLLNCMNIWCLFCFQATVSFHASTALAAVTRRTVVKRTNSSTKPSKSHAPTEKAVSRPGESRYVYSVCRTEQNRTEQNFQCCSMP